MIYHWTQNRNHGCGSVKRLATSLPFSCAAHQFEGPGT